MRDALRTSSRLNEDVCAARLRATAQGARYAVLNDPESSFRRWRQSCGPSVAPVTPQVDYRPRDPSQRDRQPDVVSSRSDPIASKAQSGKKTAYVRRAHFVRGSPVRFMREAFPKRMSPTRRCLAARASRQSRMFPLLTGDAANVITWTRPRLPAALCCLPRPRARRVGRSCANRGLHHAPGSRATDGSPHCRGSQRLHQCGACA